jgi:hypothetical protein
MVGPLRNVPGFAQYSQREVPDSLSLEKGYCMHSRGKQFLKTGNRTPI